MFRNRELKLPPQGIWPLDPGPPCRSEAGQWGPWGLRATGDPGPPAGAPAEAPGPATVDHGERGGGGRPVPCRGQHPADSPENVSSLVLAPRRRRGRAMQGRCARSTLSQLDLGFGFCTSCSRHGESRSQAPPHPVRPFLCRRTQGTQDPLAMGRQVGHDRSVRREGRHRPQRGDPGPFSAPELTSGTELCGRGTPYSSASLPVDDPGVLSFGEDSWEFSQAAPRSAGAAVGPGQRGTLRAPAAGHQSERLATSGPGPKERLCPRKIA